MQYLNLAVRAFQKVQTQPTRQCRPAKRDSRGRTLGDGGSFTLPFGPHLTPVLCPREQSQAARSPKPDCAGAAHRDGQSLTTHNRADETSENFPEDHKGPRTRTVTTNDLLDCLVHPDVIVRVTELLLDKHTGNDRTDT